MPTPRTPSKAGIVCMHAHTRVHVLVVHILSLLDDRRRQDAGNVEKSDLSVVACIKAMHAYAERQGTAQEAQRLSPKRRFADVINTQHSLAVV